MEDDDKKAPLEDLNSQLDIYHKIQEAANELYDSEVLRNQALMGITDLQTKIYKSKAQENILSQKMINLQIVMGEKIQKLNQMIEDSRKGLFTDMNDFNKLAKELIKLRKQQVEFLTTHSSIKELVSQIPLLNKIQQIFQGMIQLWKIHPMLLVGAIILGTFAKLISVFRHIDGSAAKFRISMGLVRDDTQGIEKDARALFFDLSQSGVTIDDIYDSYKGVATVIGTAQAATKGMVGDMSLLNAQLGVSQQTSGDFLRVMGQVGKTTMDASRDMAIFESRLSASGKTNLNDVMNDVANASRTAYQFMGRSPLALVKAAVEARRLGTSLGEVAHSAEQLIEFTNSVNAEMKASVLLGESLNLQRARELAYRKDLRGLNEEILNIAKQTHFEDLDPFQQKAVAEALGKSSDEIAKMLQADREMQRIRADSSLTDDLRVYEDMKRANEGIAKSQAESAREQLTIRSNQEAIKAITTALHTIWMRIFQGPVSLLAQILPPIAEGLSKMNVALGKGGALLSFIAGSIVIIFGAKGIGKLIQWIASGAGKSAEKFLGGISEGVKKFSGAQVIKGALGMFIVASSLIPLAIALQKMQGVNWKTVGVMVVSLAALTGAVLLLGTIGTVAWPVLLAGAGAIAIMGLAMIPFAYATKIAAAALSSLDKVDLLKIGEGLFDVGKSLIPLALMTPMLLPLSLGLTALSLGFRVLSGPLERVSISAEKMGMGFEKMVNAILALKNVNIAEVFKDFQNLSNILADVSKSVNNMPDMKIEKLQSIVLKSSSDTEGQKKTNEQLISAINDVKTAVDVLRKSLETGGIASTVRIDTQLYKNISDRTNLFKGSLNPEPA